MPNSKPIDYICRNLGAHDKSAFCSSCIPIYSEAQRLSYNSK